VAYTVTANQMFLKKFNWMKIETGAVLEVTNPYSEVRFAFPTYKRQWLFHHSYIHSHTPNNKKNRT
jgi:hypothetical protein